MASWEDYDDEEDVTQENSVKNTESEKETSKAQATNAQGGGKSSTSSEAPPKPAPRTGMSDPSTISQAYMASQPKVRILQRAAQPNAGQRTTSNQSTDESVARLHANLEQKQRDYEAARKKLFDEGQQVDDI